MLHASFNDVNTLVGAWSSENKITQNFLLPKRLVFISEKSTTYIKAISIKILVKSPYRNNLDFLAKST